jgi:hypothetical protein
VCYENGRPALHQPLEGRRDQGLALHVQSAAAIKKQDGLFEYGQAAHPGIKRSSRVKSADIERHRSSQASRSAWICKYERQSPMKHKASTPTATFVAAALAGLLTSWLHRVSADRTRGTSHQSSTESSIRLAAVLTLSAEPTMHSFSTSEYRGDTKSSCITGATVHLPGRTIAQRWLLLAAPTWIEHLQRPQASQLP